MPSMRSCSKCRGNKIDERVDTGSHRRTQPNSVYQCQLYDSKKGMHAGSITQPRSSTQGQHGFAELLEYLNCAGKKQRPANFDYSALHC